MQFPETDNQTAPAALLSRLTPYQAAWCIAELGNDRGDHPSVSRAVCAEYFKTRCWPMPRDFVAFVSQGRQSDVQFQGPESVRGGWIVELKL